MIRVVPVASRTFPMHCTFRLDGVWPLGLHRRCTQFRPFTAPRRSTIGYRLALCVQSGKGGRDDRLTAYRPPSEEEASLRAEAEAPFRSLRLVLFGVGTAAALLGTLFSIPTLIGALAGAPNASKSALEALQDFGINVTALGVCGGLTKSDFDKRQQQIARLMREDRLGACQLELANGKLLRLAQLRGSARPIMVAGTEEQVAAALAAAEPFKEQLMRANVVVVGLPFYASTSEDEKSAVALPKLTPDDLRWRAVPIRLDDWKKWFNEQAAAASKATRQGLYVGLRMDGRVRASGVGCPPWEKFSAQLPPSEGFFSGFLDGMDGKV